MGNIGNELLDFWSNRILPKIVDATVLILRVTDVEKFELDRSGVFLKIADAYFILTAAHKLDDRLNSGMPLCVALESDPHAVPLVESAFLGTESEGRDIAAIELSAEATKAILAEKTPITLDQLDPVAKQKEGLFLTVGYPEEWFDTGECGFKSRPLAYLGKSYHGVTPELEGMVYDESVHRVYELMQYALRLRGKLMINLPGYKGMQGISGCGIWRVSMSNPGDGSPNVPGGFRLSAIQHRYDQGNSYVHGTLIEWVLARIRADNPGLFTTGRE